MRFLGLFMAVGFSVCLVAGFRSGKMPVQIRPELDREADPYLFGGVAILYGVAALSGLLLASGLLST